MSHEMREGIAGGEGEGGRRDLRAAGIPGCGDTGAAAEPGFYLCISEVDPETEIM